MHAKNSEIQNAKLSASLDTIYRLYRQAMRRPIPRKTVLAEGFAEVWWSGNNLRYAEAMRILRQAERAFSAVLNSDDVSTAMADFTVRPDETERWAAVTIADARPCDLPRGAIVLIPPRRRAPTRAFALAA